MMATFLTIGDKYMAKNKSAVATVLEKTQPGSIREFLHNVTGTTTETEDQELDAYAASNAQLHFLDKLERLCDRLESICSAFDKHKTKPKIKTKSKTKDKSIVKAKAKPKAVKKTRKAKAVKKGKGVARSIK